MKTIHDYELLSRMAPVSGSKMYGNPLRQVVGSGKPRRLSAETMKFVYLM